MLPNSNLPNRPNLDRLKRLARALQRAARADAGAHGRVAAYFPEAGAANVKLSQAQTVIAREHGFASWAALAAAVAQPPAAPAQAEQKPTRTYPAPEMLAAAWFAHAETGDIHGLLREMTVPRRLTLAAREIMLGDVARYAAFVDVLVGGLSHRTARVRFSCAHALDTFGDERCQAPLAALMDDRVPRVRWAAMHALTCHDCGEASCISDPALLARIADHARADESTQVRRHAAVSLGFTRTDYAAGVLKELIAAQPEPKFQMMARWALRYCETGKR